MTVAFAFSHHLTKLPWIKVYYNDKLVLHPYEAGQLAEAEWLEAVSGIELSSCVLTPTDKGIYEIRLYGYDPAFIDNIRIYGQPSPFAASRRSSEAKNS